MTIRRITISVPEAVAARIKPAAGTGEEDGHRYTMTITPHRAK
jgi:hypothetical protein